MKLFALAAAIAVALTGCATSPKDFYDNPAKPKDTALCRAYLQTTDSTFKHDAAVELSRRGLTVEECQTKVNIETAAILGIAVVGTGIAVAAACRNGCDGGGYSAPRNATDYDCAGGRGDGPLYVYHPVAITGPDIYRLDADHDGTGCEATDIAQGA